MKKLLAILLALTLALGAVGTLADATLTEYAILDADLDADGLSGSDFVRVRGKNGYALADLEGNQLTADIFGSLSCDRGWIVAAKRSEDDYQTTGILDAEGKEIVPCKYGDIRLKSEKWALGVTLTLSTADNYDYSSFTGNNYYLIDTVDIYHLPEGTLVASLPRANYADCGVSGDVINIEDRATGVVTAYDAAFNPLGEVKYTSDDSFAPHYESFSENGQQGLKDPEGNVALAPSFKYVETDVRDGYFRVSTGDLYGLANVDGTVAIPAEYERIQTAYNVPGTETGSPYVVNGYVCVVKDGKMGYAKVNGGETCPPRYAKDNLENNGMSALFTDMAGDQNILAADGVESKLTGWQKVYNLDYSAGLFYRVYDGNNYGLVDWHGQEVLPCEYSSLKLSGSGRYLLAQKGYSDPVTVYELSYSFDAPAEAEAVEGEAAEGEPAGGQLASLMDSAIALLQADPAANAQAVSTLLKSAADLVGSDSPVSGVLSSAITLFETDSAANGAAVITLLESIKGM